MNGRRTASRLIVAATLALVMSCDDSRFAVDADGEAVASAADAPPARVVDSISPPAIALRRFQAGLPRPDTLAGPRSRDELVRRFLRAVSERDAAALHALTVTRAEFAHLIYPSSSVSKPPYRQPPEVAWTLLRFSNGGALGKLVNDAAARFELLSYRCPAPPIADGDVRIVSACRVRVRESGAERDVRLFGRLVEHDNRWKILSLAGDL